MMCGNGGRCIVAFSSFLGLVPADGKVFRFVAADGEHTGEIVSSEGDVATVRLGMIDCSEYHSVLDGWFLNTGTRHFVKFVDDVESLDKKAWKRRLLPAARGLRPVPSHPGSIRMKAPVKRRLLHGEVSVLPCMRVLPILRWISKHPNAQTLHSRRFFLPALPNLYGDCGN